MQFCVLNFLLSWLCIYLSHLVGSDSLVIVNLFLPSLSCSGVILCSWALSGSAARRFWFLTRTKGSLMFTDCPLTLYSVLGFTSCLLGSPASWPAVLLIPEVEGTAQAAGLARFAVGVMRPSLLRLAFLVVGFFSSLPIDHADDVRFDVVLNNLPQVVSDHQLPDLVD